MGPGRPSACPSACIEATRGSKFGIGPRVGSGVNGVGTTWEGGLPVQVRRRIQRLVRFHWVRGPGLGSLLTLVLASALGAQAGNAARPANPGDARGRDAEPGCAWSGRGAYSIPDGRVGIGAAGARTRPGAARGTRPPVLLAQPSRSSGHGSRWVSSRAGRRSTPAARAQAMLLRAQRTRGSTA